MSDRSAGTRYCVAGVRVTLRNFASWLPLPRSERETEAAADAKQFARELGTFATRVSAQSQYKELDFVQNRWAQKGSMDFSTG